jgi:uncharacterized membrane protein YqaE (UPF0057 family)
MADRPVRLNARTWRSVLAVAGLLIALACWNAVMLFAEDSAWDLWAIGFNLVLWLPIFGIAVGAMPEWTVVGTELSRRSWRSRPGRKPTKLMDLSPEVEIVHETRYRWRLHPAGLVVRTWPFPWAITGFIAGLDRAGVRVDDFRGNWERQHRRLNALAMLAYLGGFVCLFSIPALAVLIFKGLQLTQVIVAIVLFAVGSFIDRGPWRQREPAAQDG